MGCMLYQMYMKPNYHVGLNDVMKRLKNIYIPTGDRPSDMEMDNNPAHDTKLDSETKTMYLV